MRAYDVIYKKRNGGKLSREEIDFFIRSFTKGEIPDYQASALAMAVYFRGMDARETADLTLAMRDSGETWDLSQAPGTKVDKHSTGGVGDGISLVLAPLAAACGVTVPMMSGRGLAHTGGTLDKLEAIPGFRVGLSREEAQRQLREIGAAMVGQTAGIAPADKKLYALRDVTATVDSIPLITASILSKKLAEGCDALVLDVKTGDGAFMRERKDAALLARAMVNIGRRCKKKMVALITDMEEPLGNAVGNALETRQAVEILQGREERGAERYIELTEILGAWMLFLGGACRNLKDGAAKIRAARLDGRGLNKLKEIVAMQKGDPRVCDDPAAWLPRAQYVKPVVSPWAGLVSAIPARAVGLASMMLGAGRRTQEGGIDPAAGILLQKKAGDSVQRGEPLALFHYSDGAQADEAERTFLAAVKVGRVRPKPRPLVYHTMKGF